MSNDEEEQDCILGSDRSHYHNHHHQQQHDPLDFCERAGPIPPSHDDTTTIASTGIVVVDDDNGTHHHDDSVDPFGYKRVTRFVCFAFMFWSLVLFLTYEHEDRAVILLLTGLCLVLVYLLVSICIMIVIPPDFQILPKISNGSGGGGSTGLLDRTFNGSDDGVEVGLSSNDNIFDCTFEDTPKFVRNGHEDTIGVPNRYTSNIKPPDGDYKVVYAAILFGKQVRTEGVLHLKFVDDDVKTGGWKIEGESVFGKSRQTLQDGFLNTDGKMYWIVTVRGSLSKSTSQKSTSSVDTLGDAVLYRGMFNFESQCLDDGEFQSMISTTNKKNVVVGLDSSKIAQGRIVRLEYKPPSTAPNSNIRQTSNTEMELVTIR